MRLPLLIAALLLPLSATAAETAWVELAPDTRIRLIAAETRSADGTSLAALELDMPANTKTYWRVPGETGIPLQLDFAGSESVAGGRVIWPFPRIEMVGGYTDFVLSGHVVLPVELDVGTAPAPRVRLKALMGICSDICVPANAAFDLPLDFSSPDAGNGIRIEQALALAPLAWDGDGAPVGQVSLDPVAETLRVAIDPARLDAATLIVDASDAGYVFGAPQKSPETDLVDFHLLGGGDLGDLGGKTVSFVFMTRDGPYEVTRDVEPLTGNN